MVEHPPCPPHAHTRPVPRGRETPGARSLPEALLAPALGCLRGARGALAAAARAKLPLHVPGERRAGAPSELPLPQPGRNVPCC